MDNILSTESIDDQQLRPFGYIYLTVNLINNKKYIGKHKSSKFDPNYKGSGKVLWKAINKYGWDNFSVEVLKWCLTEEDLNESEKQIILEKDCCNSPEYYNVMPGGQGGDNKKYLSETEYQAYIQKIKDSKKRERTDAEKQHMKYLHSLQVGRHHSEESKQKSRESNLGQVRSEEARRHMSENHADFSGPKNPMYGVHQVVSEETRSKLSRQSRGRFWITNCIDDEKLIFKQDLDKYKGYVRGRLRPYQKVKFND